MARCGCGTGGGTSIINGPNTVVSGTGTEANPYVIAAHTDCAEARACFSATGGVNYNSATGAFSADLSADPGNTVILGVDGGLFVPTGANVSVGCGLTGNGSVTQPIAPSVTTWPFGCDITTNSSRIFCDPATGQLRGEPAPLTHTSFEVQIHNFAGLPVPATGMVLTPIDTFSFNYLNPDPCRTLRCEVWASLDVEFDLPVGATAEFAIEGDRVVAMSNTGSATLINQHFQVPRKVLDTDVAAGAVQNQIITVQADRGAGGATVNRIQVEVTVRFDQNSSY